MFKAVLLVCLCVAVLSASGHRQQMPRQFQGHQRRINRPEGNQNRPQNGHDGPHNRIARQAPPMPGMNPAELPKLMADGVQTGIGTMANMMNPGKWMQAASQMIPQPNDSH